LDELENGRISTFMGIPIVISDNVESLRGFSGTQIIIDEVPSLSVGQMINLRRNMQFAHSEELQMVSTPYGSYDEFEAIYNKFIGREKSLSLFFKSVDSMLSSKERVEMVNRIVREIEKNEDYSSCFRDIKAEVESWNDIKLKNWR